MGKDANKKLMSNSGFADSLSSQANTRGGKTRGFIQPMLESEATNPQGYTPQQMAYMNTASQQSLGGGTAATTGQANLEAARTRNAGGFQPAVGTANRSNARQASQNALQVQTDQANLQQQQKQAALKSLQDLYGIDEKTALGYLDASNTSLHDENQSHPVQEGFRTGADVLSALTGAAKTGSQIHG